MTILVPEGRSGRVRAFTQDALSNRAEKLIQRITPLMVAEREAVKKLIEAERAVALRRQSARSQTIEKILFHRARGMSEATLIAKWGRDAVMEAMEAAEAGNRCLQQDSLLETERRKVA